MTWQPEDWERRWHLYYCYAADGTLLYVGQTSRPIWERIEFHGRYDSPSAEWFYYCAEVVASSEPIRTRAAALAAEKAEIQRLRPVFNKHHNPDPTPWEKPAHRLPRKYLEHPPTRFADSAPMARAS